MQYLDQYFDQYEDPEEPLDNEEESDEELIDENADEPTEETVVREDKIFNNRYNTGDGLSESDDFEYSRKISVSSEYSNTYLKDLYEYEDVLDSKLILNNIFSFVQNDAEIKELIKKKTTKPVSSKLKLSKDEINFLFTKINETFDTVGDDTMFYSPIYVMEVISAITSIEYKKLFDMMDTEIQEILLLELNAKYRILDGGMHKKRIH